MPAATRQKLRNPDCPLVCVDETSKQLIVETRADPRQARTRSPTRLRIRAANIMKILATPLRRFATQL
jgi:hypothetical protein